MQNSIMVSGIFSFSPFAQKPPPPRVWVLDHGCHHEGGSVIAVYSTEEAGLAAAEAYMTKEVADTAEMSNPEDPCRMSFIKRDNDQGHHVWNENYEWSFKDDAGVLQWCGGGAQYLALRWYELQ